MRERELSGWGPDPEERNEVQELQLKLLELTQFNSFYGLDVAEGLRSHRELWRAAILLQPPPAYLLPLRDLEDGFWNADTLMVLSSQKDDERLEFLARTWDPDEVEWITGPKADELLGWGGSKARILSVWWG